MSSKTRKLKFMWMFTAMIGGEPGSSGLNGTFRGIYKIATFDLQIAKPSLTERAAREQYKKTGNCLIYNKLEFESLDEARFSPIGKVAWIRKVPIRKT